MGANLPAAVLWDMDGTLIDSEPYWIAAETELCTKFGVPWTHQDGLSLVGNSLEYSAGILRERGVLMESHDIIDHLIGRVTMQVRERAPWQQDAFDLLNDVLAAGIPCALVTMSYKQLADALLARVPEAFAVVVTGDEVAKGKPDPEAFLLAASRLGVDIHECVAFEDSISGVASALASAARTVGVQRLIPVEPQAGLSRVASLEGLTVADIREIAAGKVIDQLA
ncbi:HAD family hydrolase [Demequina sp.]|uniref:HAD family hydrolase n=1 Tax=Demequina sp. TaxID=2050685 RepID=UPI003D0DCD1E